jgi:hypothetical protein
VVNTLALSWPAHTIYGLLEVDVTLARKFIAEHEVRTARAAVLRRLLDLLPGAAVDEDKTIQAYRKGDKQLILFDDVDVGLMVERTVGEKRLLMGHTIRAANRKTYREIHDEIRKVQSEPVPTGRGMPSWFRSAMLLPWPLSRLVIALLRLNGRRDPTIAVSMGGTVALTSVGMFGGGHSGWGLSPTLHPLGLVVGGISWKPTIVDGRIEPREILNLTVSFDHDIVDGGPATRFVRRLVELIESGYGLCEEEIHAEQATTTQDRQG